MTDRADRLRQLAAEISDHSTVDDAFLAKSFTDRLLVVDVSRGADVPESVMTRLAEHDLYGAADVYGTDDTTHSHAGDVGDSTRHHFVDVQTQGSHRSYVVD